jgi:RNA polymerase sigma-70 factor (ECF subfamily)
LEYFGQSWCETGTGTAKQTQRSESADIAGLTRGMQRLEGESYRTFFQLYYRRLWAYLFALAKGCDKEIEDALQSAFAKLIKNIKVFETESEFWAWLCVVCRNAYLDHHRKERSFQRIKEFFRCSRNEEKESLQPLVDDHYMIESKLNHALLELDKEERYLVERKYFTGASYRPFAVELGTTEKAIESRLARVRSKLRRLIRKEVD